MVNSFFALNLGILVLGVIYLFWRIPRGSGFKLNLKKGGRVFSPSFGSSRVPEVRKKDRPLQVYFNYNGETFDAFEVLGLPAGATAEQIGNRMKELKDEGPIKDRSLHAAAFQALETTYLR